MLFFMYACSVPTICLFLTLSTSEGFLDLLPETSVEPKKNTSPRRANPRSCIFGVDVNALTTRRQLREPGHFGCPRQERENLNLAPTERTQTGIVCESRMEHAFLARHLETLVNFPLPLFIKSLPSSPELLGVRPHENRNCIMYSCLSNTRLSCTQWWRVINLAIVRNG